MRSQRLFPCAMVYLLGFWTYSRAAPIQIFILAGQSNMVGMGSVEHLDRLVLQCRNNHSRSSNSTLNEYQEALCQDGTYIVRDDVFVKFNDHHGNLSVGRESGFAARRCFGPELMFGVEIGNYFRENGREETILLIKTAWGGKSLAVDFRPPASGEGNFSGVRPIQYGTFYRAMLMDVLDTLRHLDNFLPHHRKEQATEYEIAGFVWFQGWNDMLQWTFVNEYATNLANLIRDVRRDLGVPSLPFIIGELGMHGPVPKGRGKDRVLRLRAAQLYVSQRSEFRNTSLFVPTSPFVVSNGSHFNGAYHYYGRADTYFHIGRAMGRGMLTLLGFARESRALPVEIYTWDQASKGLFDLSRR